MLNDEASIVQVSFGFNHGQNSSHRVDASNSFGDYLMGPGLDLLLQCLAENDPNRHGTPPAKKEVVKAMPTVTKVDSMQCCVCLEDIEIGSEAKEMPCKDKFHCGCITSWLELHSSCPICRFRLPLDDSKIEANFAGNSGRRYWIPIPWPYDGLLTLPSSQIDSTSAPLLEAVTGSASAAQTNDT